MLEHLSVGVLICFCEAIAFAVKEVVIHALDRLTFRMAGPSA